MLGGRYQWSQVYSWWIAFYYAAILLTCRYFYDYLPPDTKDFNSPISVEAIHWLHKNLADLGPRVTGSCFISTPGKTQEIPVGYF